MEERIRHLARNLALSEIDFRETQLDDAEAQLRYSEYIEEVLKEEEREKQRQRSLHKGFTGGLI